MKRVLCILMSLCMASAVSAALLITNGDFDGVGSGVQWDVLDWYDYGDDTLESEDYSHGKYEGPFQFSGSFSIDGWSVFSGERANEDEDGGNHAYIYQSIGTYDGTLPAVDIELDWTVPDIAYASSGEVGVTVMILESDGTFEPNEWEGVDDVYDFVKTEEEPDMPITEIGRGTVFRYVEKGTSAMTERFQIDLSDVTVGNELFLRLNGYRGELEDNDFDKQKPWIVMDNLKMSPAYVLNRLPEPFIEDDHNYVAVELDSPENDLVFDVTDDSIVAVDILLSMDPNVPDDDVIVPEMSIPAAGQYAVDLESGLPANLLQDGHLKWSKDYYWKVIAYESDGGTGYTFKYEGLVTSFRTIQEGPYLEAVEPDIQGVWAGDDAEFELGYYNKTDTFQWYKEGEGGNPDVPLANGSKYAGVDSNSLTIHDCQTADEGLYYCKGTETATEAYAFSPSGELAIKELKSYYPFETTGSDGEGTYSPDTKGGKHAYLRDGASVGSGTDPNSIIGGFLRLDNPRPRGETQQYAEFIDDSVAHHRDITISCWVRPTVLDLDFERYARVFDFGKDAENYFFLTLLEHSNTASCHMTDDDPDDQHIEGEGDIGYGTKWLYVVFTLEDITELNDEGEEETTATGKIYINGQLAPGEDGEYSGGGLDHPSDIEKTLNYIGKAIAKDPDDNTVPNFDGLIDELKIYNYAQTAEEIAQDYMDVMTGIEYMCDLEASDFQDLDYDDNCEIGLPDLAEMVEKWLQNYFIYPD